MKKGKFATAAALILAISFFTGCSLKLPFVDDNDDDGTGKQLNISISDVPDNLDPQTAQGAGSQTIISNIYEGLLKRNKNGEIVMGVASDYKVSDDGLTYTFEIRDDAKWFYDKNNDNYMDDDEFSDVTADDFVFAFQRIFDPQTESPYKDEFKIIKNWGSTNPNGIGVKAVDKKTVEFQLSEPDAEFLNLLTSTAAMPCNEKFFNSTKGRYGLDKTSINSNGPFFIQQWFYDPYGNNNFIFMHRNIDYSKNDVVMPKAVNISIEKDKDAEKEKFKDENSDLLISDEYYDKYFKDKDYSVTNFQDTTCGLIFNKTDAIFKNDDIRKGLRLAIDENSLKKISGPETSTAQGVVPPAVNVLGKSYREIVSEDNFTVSSNSSKAKELVSNGLKSCGQSKFPQVKILVSSSSVNSSYLQPIIEKWASDLNLFASIDEVDTDEFVKRIEENNYQIALYDLKSSENSIENFMNVFLESDNIFGFKSSEISSLDNSLKDKKNLKDYLPVYEKMEKEILDSNCFCPLFYKSDFLITKSNVEGFIFDPFSNTIRFQYVKKFSAK